jgi:hypothetical protein
VSFWLSAIPQSHWMEGGWGMNVGLGDLFMPCLTGAIRSAWARSGPDWTRCYLDACRISAIRRFRNAWITPLLLSWAAL